MGIGSWELVLFHWRPGWFASAESAALPMTVMHRQKDLVLSEKRRVLLCSVGFLFRGILRGRDRTGAQFLGPFFPVARADLAMPFEI